VSHAERMLAPGERIVCRARLHWIIFTPGLLSIVGGSIAAVYGATLADVMAHDGYLTIGAALLAAGLFSLLRALVRRRHTVLVISTQRVIYKPGWGRRGVSEVKLDEAVDLTVSQGVLGRQFNFGAVTVRGGAVVGPVSNVASPRDLRLPSGPPGT
jgi:hypothetical protein